jgi:hypothetical protein
MSSKQIDFLVKLRDGAQMIADATNEYLESFAPAGAKEQSFVKEETMTILKFEDAKGERLGEFQIAHKSSNLPDKWSSAYNVLRQNNAVINSRYSGPSYQFSYWLYGEDKIYRQRLRK